VVVLSVPEVWLYQCVLINEHLLTELKQLQIHPRVRISLAHCHLGSHVKGHVMKQMQKKKHGLLLLPPNELACRRAGAHVWARAAGL